MSNSKRRRSLALSAILASSVLPVLELTAPEAHAVNAGAADSALTISDGSSAVVIGGRVVTFPTTVTDATWAPDGSRMAYVDAAGDLVSSLADGSGVRVLAHGGPGTVISHPTWDADGGGVPFGESVGGGPSTIGIAKADGYGGSALGSDGPMVRDSMAGAGVSQPDSEYKPVSDIAPYAIDDYFVYQKVPAEGSAPEVWGIWGVGQDVITRNVADGSQPTISPDRRYVAFVNAQGQIAVVDLQSPPPYQVKVLTTDSMHKQHPTFSPDGSRIAYEAFTPGTGGGADKAKDVEAIPATGGNPTVVWAKPGVPAYRTAVADHVTRLAGADRIGTAIAISQARFPNAALDAAWPKPRPTTVVLSRSDQFADALAGSVLAKNSPLLLTPTGALDPAVKSEMQRVLGTPDRAHPQTVYLLGGPQALSPQVQSDVEALGYQVQRLAGADRYETSVAIAKTVPDLALLKVGVATGNNFADALSAGATGYPVVLTDDKVMPAVTADYLRSVTSPNPSHSSRVTVFAVGGQAEAATEALWPSGSANRPPVLPLAGADRFETSFLVAREFFGTTPNDNHGKVYLGVSTAFNWPDSLAGGAAMSDLGGALLLADPKKGLTDQEKQWASANSGTVSSSLVFGGPQAISASIDDQLGRLLSGPAGYIHQTNPSGVPK